MEELAERGSYTRFGGEIKTPIAVDRRRRRDGPSRAHCLRPADRIASPHDPHPDRRLRRPRPRRLRHGARADAPPSTTTSRRGHARPTGTPATPPIWPGTARKPGWTTTASGLQYRRVGRAHPTGRQPAATDTVSVHYRGTFVDGREFDSSYARNEPAEFPLNRVIKGWTEGVGLMREGEKFEFVIPAALGYGERWVGGDELPPNSTLLFTVELLEREAAA